MPELCALAVNVVNLGEASTYWPLSRCSYCYFNSHWSHGGRLKSHCGVPEVAAVFLAPEECGPTRWWSCPYEGDVSFLHECRIHGDTNCQPQAQPPFAHVSPFADPCFAISVVA